jgi:hypothetical protein
MTTFTESRTLGTGRHSAKTSLSSAKRSAKGHQQPSIADIHYLCQAPNVGTRENKCCRVLKLDTRQNIFFFFLFCNQTFCGLFLHYVDNMFHFSTIIKVFAINIRFCSFNWIFSDNSDLNCKSLEKWKTVNAKMISMLFSTSYDRFQE